MTTAATLPAPAAVDPIAERASFFFDLEMAELTMTIPQATVSPTPVQKY